MLKVFLLTLVVLTLNLVYAGDDCVAHASVGGAG
jgi:hypothetical protein